jgi:hypothetical protein
MFTNVGLNGSAGLMVGIIVVFAVLPIIFIQLKGGNIREKRASNELDKVNTITR